MKRLHGVGIVPGAVTAQVERRMIAGKVAGGAGYGDVGKGSCQSLKGQVRA